jgi:hypothetical protein
MELWISAGDALEAWLTSWATKVPRWDRIANPDHRLLPNLFVLPVYLSRSVTVEMLDRRFVPPTDLIHRYIE